MREFDCVKYGLHLVLNEEREKLCMRVTYSVWKREKSEESTLVTWKSVRESEKLDKMGCDVDSYFFGYLWFPGNVSFVLVYCAHNLESCARSLESYLYLVWFILC